MANLGIKVKVDFSQADKDLDAFEKKWKALSKEDNELKVKVDSEEITKLKNTVDSLKSSMQEGIKLKVDTKEATSNLDSFKQKFQSIKQEIEKGLDIKLGSDGVDSKGMDTVIRNSDNLAKGLQAAQVATNEMHKSYESMNTTVSKLNSENLEGVKQISGEYDKLDSKRSGGSRDYANLAKNETAALRQMADVIKEIGRIEKGSVGKSGEEFDVMRNRVELLTSQLKDYKSSYEKTFGQSADNSVILKTAQDLSDYNLKLKEATQNQKEASTQMKDWIKLKNEEHALRMKQDTAGDGEASVIQKQIDKLREKGELLKANNAEAKMTPDQREQISMLESENKLIRERAQAKREDKALADASKANYQELLGYQKQIFSVEKSIAELKAQEKNDVLDAKGAQRLAILEKEKVAVENVYNARKNQASIDGKLLESDTQLLAVKEKQHKEQMKIVEASSQAKAKAKEQAMAYKEIEDAMKRIDSLNDLMANAGSAQANEAKSLIASEEARIEKLKEALKLRGLESEEMNAQIDANRRLQQQETEDASRLSRAKDADERGYTGVFTQMLDPSRVYQQGKTAAMAMFESVRTLDTAFTDIAKVADVPSEVLNQFSRDIFDQASAIGLAAEDYAVSVERWLTTGRAFQESIDIAQVSSMGGFVGNIGEEEMVKYMSVPLQAFKKDMLDAKDIVNAMNEVSNNNAVTIDDLGMAYERAAQTASISGESFSELTGLIAGANANTMAGGEKIGTALKSVDLNFNKISTGITKADVERGDFFKGIGVNLKGSNGELRSTYDIIKDLAGVWDNLNSDQKGQAQLYAAGKNHAAVFSAMVTGWKDVEKAKNEAERQVGLTDKESGSAYQEFETQKQSVEFKTQQLKNSWNEFLHVVSGGKEGVNGVLDILQDVMDKAIELAENDGVMKFAEGIVKLIAISSGLVGVNKVFKLIGDGSKDVGVAFKNLGGLFGGTVKGADGVSKSFGTIMKSSSGIGKVTGIFGMLGTGIGSLIPIIGGVVAAMTLLDALGVPVWETLGNVVDSVAKKFESAEKKASKANEEFSKSQKDIAKSIDDNKVLNNTIKEADEAIQTYKDLRDAKEKAFANGEIAARSFSGEEFTLLQEQAAKMSELLGIDVNIEFNDYNHIVEQFEKLMAYKSELQKEESSKAAKGIDEASKTKDLSKDRDSYKEEVEKAEKKLKKAMATLTRKTNWNDKEELEKSKANVMQKQLELNALNDFHSSKAAIEAKERDRERTNTLMSARGKLGAQLEAGTLDLSTSSEKEKETIVTSLTSYVRKIKTETKGLTDVQKNIRKAFDDWNNGNKEASVSKEAMEYVRQITGDPTKSSMVNEWADHQEIWDNVVAAIAEAEEKAEGLRQKLISLATESGLTQSQIEGMVAALDSSNADYVKYMIEQGDVGVGMLGVGSLFQDRDNWQEELISIQTQLDSMDLEKAIKLKIATEDGLVNGSMLDDILGIPDEIQKKFKIIDDSGNINVENTIALIETLEKMPLDSETTKKFTLETGGIDINAFVKEWKTFEDETKDEIRTKLGIDVVGETKANELLQTVREFEEKQDKTVGYKIEVDDSGREKIVYTKNEIDSLDGKEANATVNADDSNAKSAIDSTKAGMAEVDILEAETLIKGNDTPFQTTLENVKKVEPPSVLVTLKGILDGVLTRIFGGGSVSINANVKESKSIGILDRNMGRSFSSSISSIVGANRSANVGVANKSQYTSSRDENKTINSDVWRYWSKELFTGLPLERSMDDLEIAITKAKENYEKLIPLYKEQISLLDKQIAYQNSMKNETQSELNDILSQLRGKGFTTSGNQVTNLSRAKSFTGDGATEVEELLNKWKTLYESLDTINGKINSLSKSKWDTENDIKDAKVSQEQEKIEKHLKKTEALLTSIQNHMSIMSKKESLVSDADVELKLTVQEESSNEAKKNITSLIDEFNRLSATTIEYEENASDVQSQLESLKSEILSNADSVVEYRESMNQLKIDRLVNDYAKFNETIQRNTSLLENNIEALKEGLVSGTKFGDLESSDLGGLTFNRINSLNKQYQDRLQLEAKLDSALDAFAKRNVDRAKDVANAQLQIEKSKYQEFLKMSSDYSNGKTPSYNQVGGSFDLGTSSIENNPNNKEYNNWLDKMKKINEQYVREFSSMRDEFDKNMSQATTKSQKDALTNKLIVDQLKLQEKIQSDIIKLNKEAIAQTQKQLKNGDLTTEQREQLEQSILDYKDSSIEAQQVIRDSIQSRFELEFDAMDKLSEKAEKYSDHIKHLLDISDLLNSSPDSRQPLVDKIYEAKANEYNTAKKSLESLIKQQKEFEEGSLEWNILQEKIEDVDKSLKDLTVGLLEANKDILSNKLASEIDKITKGALGGKTLDDWKTFDGRWMTGIEKEIELEKIRRRLLEIEDKTLQGKMEYLDKQEAISKKDLEYLDKQTKVLELQNKLSNLDKERTVQTLVKNDDGTYDWQYVADQTEIDKAKDELLEAEKDLELFRREQQANYIEDMQKAIDKAKDGGFESTEALQKELEDIRKAYGAILNDIPDFNMGSIEEILSAYDKFLEENGAIIDDALNSSSNKEFEKKLEKVGTMFETSFKNIAEDLGKIIGDSLKEALQLAGNARTVDNGQVYTIQNMELSFPNVSDTTGFEDVLLDLPQVTIQKVHSK